jgi:CRP-like cAMP-binding protein
MQSKNRLLALLSPEDFALISSELRIAEMKHGQLLARPHEHIKHVYFPHGGIISYVVELSDGQMIETGMVGLDGVMGAIQALDGKVSPNKIMCQVPGAAFIIESEKVSAACNQSASLRGMLAKHEQFFTAQIQQSVACNAAHAVEPRMCRWLLRMYDLVGPELPLTQEFLGQMMGVRRTSVSLVASQLQEAGLIAYRRGHVRIIDAEKLKSVACECHEAVNAHYRKIFQTSPPTRSNVATEFTNAPHSH